MLIAAWTKEAMLDVAARESTAEGRLRIAEEPLPPGQSLQEPLLPGPPGKRYKVVPVPQRKADTVAVAAGAVLGLTVSFLASQVGKAARSLRR
jgi:membrane protein